MASAKILRPLLYLSIGVLIVAVILIVRDHAGRSYTSVANIARIVELAAAPPPEPGRLAGIVNPDDSRYVQVAVRGWQFWSGKSAVVQDHYVRLLDIDAESIERLVMGDRGVAATVVLRIDLSRTKGNVYKVDQILRSGTETGDLDRTMEIYPVTLAGRPPVSSGDLQDTYVQSHRFDYRRENTFENVGTFAATGLLQRQDGAYRIQCKGFNIVLDESFSPGVAALVEDLAGKKVTENMTWYLQLEETFDWGTKSEPGRRQSAGEIGRAKLDGVLIGKIYIANS